MVWKSALYDYVYFKNQVEAQPLLAHQKTIFIADNLKDVQTKRAETIAFWHRERNMNPLKNESRLKVVQVRETEKDVQVDIRIRRLFEYDIGGTVHRDYRVEKERVTMVQLGNNWKVCNIIPLDAERSEKLQEWPAEAFPPVGPHDVYSEDEAVYPSVPYIHPGLYSPYSAAVRKVKYDRLKVKQYADRWWNSANPAFIRFDVDCTNYVSQCVFAGGAPMHYTGKRGLGWWYHGKDSNRELWSFSWAVAHSLNSYLSFSQSGLHAEVVDSPNQLTIGDVISYDWNGNGRYQHSTIVTGIAADGAPLVNAHTTASSHRYWDYRDSYAWTERTKYRFLHIPDEF